MRQVTKEEFFATVGQMDVHPRPEKYETLWELRGSRRLVGRTLPGYLGTNPDDTPCEKSWYVADDVRRGSTP